MRVELIQEVERLTVNAARRRRDLQVTGLHKAKRRKALTVLAGVLALTSAGAITTVISRVFGSIAIQLAAALTAAVSGTVSLLITSYYSDDAVFNMLLGSTKYLALRENVYRLVIHPSLTDDERFRLLEEFQVEYARLDETYSRYFSVGDERFISSEPPRVRVGLAIRKSVAEAGLQEREHFRKELDKLGLDPNAS